MATGSQDTTEEAPDRRVLAQFKSEDGNLVGTPFDLPVTISKMNLQSLCNAVLMNVSSNIMFAILQCTRPADRVWYLVYRSTCTLLVQCRLFD